VPAPNAKLYLLEQSLRRRKARRQGSPSPALQARAKVHADRLAEQDARRQLALQAQALERMRRA
jgi:hypothetical protein